MGPPKSSCFGGTRAAIRKRNEATREGLANEWRTVQNRQRIGESQPLAALLPRRSEQEELAVDEMDANDMRMAEVVSRERHVKRMAALRREQEAIQGETAKLRALLTSVQQAAAHDMRVLASTLASTLHKPPVRGVAAAAAAAAAEERRAAALAAKHALTEQLQQQANEMEALVARAAAQAARAQRVAAAATMRRAQLLRGARLHRWDETTRTLCPCDLALVADGRCLQATDADPLRTGPPLLVPLSRLRRPALTARTRDFRAGGGLPLHQPWLYFTVRWATAAPPSAEYRGASAMGVVVHTSNGALMGVHTSNGAVMGVHTSNGAGSAAPLHAHFCAATRSEAAGWLLGLYELVCEHELMRECEVAEAVDDGDTYRPSSFELIEDVDVKGGAVAAKMSAGSLLWQQVGLRLEEEARLMGKRPQEVLAAAIRKTVADRAQVMLAAAVT